MVNEGRPPRACLNCKRRRIKCDYQRPSCARCLLAKIDCNWPKPGDKPSIQFVDMNQAVAARHYSHQKRRGHNAPSTLSRTLHDDVETQALTFFIRHYSLDSIPGGPNPGLFGYVMPALSSTRTSPVSLSLSAVALTVYSRWRMDRSLTQLVAKVLGQAIKILSYDLQQQDTRQSDMTLLTTLLLQFHCSFESLMFSKKSTIVHHLGALALVKEFGDPSNWSAIAYEFVGCLIHLDITAAVREQRQVHSDVRYWRTIIASTPKEEPSRHIDTLGIQVADLQFRASALQKDLDFHSSSAEVHSLLDEIQELDDCLMEWQGQVSTFWGPFSWTPPGVIFPPLQSFQGTCHVYTSVTAARRMNDSRSHRLTLALMSLKLISRGASSSPELCESKANQSRAFVLVKRIQWLLDGICGSVPFCLGNRSRVGTTLDFVDSTWRFPSCHDMPDGMYGLYGRLAEPMGLESYQNHYCHALTQGSWLMLSNLALLVSIFLSNKILTPLFPLKEGQLPWICQQYLRNLSLNAIVWTHDSGLAEKVLTGVNLPPEKVLISEASRCVRCVSRGLQLTDEP